MQSINDTKDYLDLVFDDIEHFKTNRYSSTADRDQ